MIKITENMKEAAKVLAADMVEKGENRRDLDGFAGCFLTCEKLTETEIALDAIMEGDKTFFVCQKM